MDGLRWREFFLNWWRLTFDTCIKSLNPAAPLCRAIGLPLHSDCSPRAGNLDGAAELVGRVNTGCMNFCMNETITLKPLRWELIVVMASRRIKTMTELSRRLHAVGYEISAGQLGRLAYAELPGRLNIELLRALMTVLDCGLSDLLVEGEE